MRRRQGLAWPYLIILSCLFALSISAPRTWQQVARKGSLRGTLALCRSEAMPPAPLQALSVAEASHELPDVAPQVAAVAPNETPNETLPVVVDPEPALAHEYLADGDAATQTEATASESAEAAEDSPAVETATNESNGEPPDAIEPDAPKPAPHWPAPTALVQQLGELAARPAAVAWAKAIEDQITRLCGLALDDHDARDATLAELARLADDEGNGTPTVDAAVARVRFNLHRRLVAWQPASKVLRTGVTLDAARSASHVGAAIAKVELLITPDATGQAWRNYLLLDRLRGAVGAADPPSPELRKVALDVVSRIARPGMSRQQRAFLRSAPVEALRDQLDLLSGEPADPLAFLADVECFETDELPSCAARLSSGWRRLRPLLVEAGEPTDWFDTYYRNANLRVAISKKLLDRMLKQPGAVESPVRDTIVGVPVRGRSTTFTQLSLRFVSDDDQLRVGLEATGVVDSNTSSTSGPATFYTTGQSTFTVRKLVVVDRRGVCVWPAIAEADSGYSDLISLETDYDGVPLVGSLVRNMALSRHEESRGDVRVEVEQKVAARGREQLDSQVEPRLEQAVSRVYQRTLVPLEHLGLEPEPIGLTTTEDRLTVRMRLAGEKQLAAFNARPRAPSDSLMSVQLHDSAVNNAAEKLNLDGRTCTLPELYVHLAERLSRPELAKRNDLPEDVRVTFAPRDAVRVRFEGGRIAVAISFAELTQGRKRWRDFTVRTYYRPEVAGLEPRFVRDGSIYLEGESVRGKTEVVLRSIFSKVLSRNRAWSLVDPKFFAGRQTSDLCISQFMVERGWAAVAYAPKPVPANVATRPNESDLRP